MGRGTTLFLKAAVIVIGLPVLALCIFIVPQIAGFAAELYPEHSYLKVLVAADLYASAVPFYYALYQAFKLLGYIDRNEAFSELSVRALTTIKYCAIAISGLIAAGMPIYFLMADKDDAPGLVAIGLIIIFASLVIAVFAAVLQRLLQQAIELKSENDLTV
ncbi:DUF2975 domain-containing protein [Paenibacillus tepidiphilus]|uniref:DUF2975 domain-containing protein n=1 Tax=Paenibacillus tepidiphilus TaxID=2608683 RepID=UPI00123B496B|nr:DUF2975 domain-containing protein [Paenibacillus tepidiphilus]